MRIYKQLTSVQRYQISALKRMGHSRTEIAKELEVHRSTIGRELYRNTGERGYRPKQADEKACAPSNRMGGQWFLINSPPGPENICFPAVP